MKIRSSIFLFIVMIVTLIALVLWHGKKQPVETPPTAEIETNAAPIATTTPSAPASVPAHVSTLPAQLVTNGLPAPPQSKWEQLQPILATQNDQPIVFYGKVEDQFGNSIADAQIAADVRIYNGVQHTLERFSQKSDANGLFTISGYKGERLGLNVKKQGYVLVSISGSTIYSKLWPENQRAHPDPNNPTVIKMYKLQGAEHLVSFNIKTYIPIDGTLIKFDLQTGRQVESGGDLTVSIKSSSVPRVQEGYDWEASIQMADGGIIQDSSGLGLEKMFQAPDSGYAPEFDLNFQKGTQQWTSRFIGGFYFTSRNGQSYGKMAISIITDRIKNGNVPITINGYLNPAGSKNLEIDPTK
jgi:hypothetical protein